MLRASWDLEYEAGGQAAPDRVEFQFGYGSFETEKQATVGTSRIIDTIAIGDEAAAQSADVQERIPVRAIAREARHVDASIRRCSERTVERERNSGTGCRYIKIGRAVRYRRRDVVEFLDRHARLSTSENAR